MVSYVEKSREIARTASVNNPSLSGARGRIRKVHFFGLMEKDVLCATMTMTITVGVDLGFSWGVSFCFSII